MDKFMKAAFQEALKAYEIMEVPVGAIIVKDQHIIARAHNVREKHQNAISHAEILCIQKACKKLKSWRLDGCEMYATLEPCAMCAGALTQARIAKIHFGALDQKNGCIVSNGHVLDFDLTHKVAFEFVPQNECSAILSDFFKELRNSKK